ncbi:hypothetical protein ABVT39_003699 [Epinephelus coioides]
MSLPMSLRNRPHQASEPELPERPSANEEMLRSIKVMMNDQQTEIVRKFETIISELVKKEVATALKQLQEKVSLQSGTLSDLERCANEHSYQLTSIQVKRELHACGNVKFGLRYPATLHITTPSGETYRFEDPDQALEFVNKRLKKNPAPDSD